MEKSTEADALINEIERVQYVKDKKSSYEGSCWDRILCGVFRLCLSKASYMYKCKGASKSHQPVFLLL